MNNLLRHLLTGLGSLSIALSFASTGHAQVVYGVGQAGTAAVTIPGSNRLFSINTTTGAATNICALSSPSTAVSVSSIDGQAYYIDRDGTGVPKLYRINPLTCANTFVGNITGAASAVLGDVTLRATHCPDGRFYAATNVGQFFEINANNAATLRSLTWTGLPTGGSGDFACVNNGDLYSVAPITNGSGTYRLYRANAASFATVPSGSAVPVTQIGANLALTGVPNGIAEGPTGAGCAASPAPCLYASNSTNDLWRINSTTGAASVVGPTNNGLTDLSRSFPVDLSFTKTVTPTTALQGQTVFYTLTASNPGPGVVQNILIQDAFPAGVANASWACAVQNPGSATLVTTSCGTTPTGTGNINTTVSLSLNATLRYNVTATLSNTFSGNLTNVGRATITVPVTDPNPNNNTGTATATVTPAANLTVFKTNAVGTLTTGQTTTYTLDAFNNGPANVANAVLRDPAVAGLSCTAVTCAPLGAGTCPAPATLTIANLQGPGVPIPLINSASGVRFSVTCTVTASGVP
jgi:uncharacterized repeat protein (TIGR01451 family)